MGKLADYRHHVIDAVKAEPGITQTDLSERVWGTSGRGAPTLIKILFPNMVTLGYLTAETNDRTVRYTVTAKGLSERDAMEDVIRRRVGWPTLAEERADKVG